MEKRFHIMLCSALAFYSVYGQRMYPKASISMSSLPSSSKSTASARTKSSSPVKSPPRSECGGKTPFGGSRVRSSVEFLHSFSRNSGIFRLALYFLFCSFTVGSLCVGTGSGISVFSGVAATSVSGASVLGVGRYPLVYI